MTAASVGPHQPRLRPGLFFDCESAMAELGAQRRADRSRRRCAP